ALKYYLINVYMEATGKQQGYLGMGVQRMANWLLHTWRELAGGPETLRIYVTFQQYEIEDEEGRIALAMKANGGLPVMTHRASITYAGMEEDSEAAIIEMGSPKSEST